MQPWTIVLLVVLAIMIAGLVFLYFWGRKMQRRQEEGQATLQANKQLVTMLIIDKKKIKITESGLPQAVIDQTPKYLRRSKVPVVKAKIGPQIATLMCDEKIYNLVPVKKEVKASISGIYILEVKALRGSIQKQEETKKKGFLKRTIDRLQEKAGAKPL